MSKKNKIFKSILIYLLAVTCLVIVCMFFDKQIDILSWCGGCAFYMIGQILARWIYE